MKTRQAPGLLLLAGLYACMGCEAPPRDGATGGQPASRGRNPLIEASSTGAALEPPLASTTDPPAREAIGTSVGGSEPVPRVDAGVQHPDTVAHDAGGGDEACPYPSYPPTEWSPEPWVPVASSEPAELLAGVLAVMPGRWEGLATSPWTTPYRVELAFTADGHYSGRCAELSSDCCLAFYYGSDDDTPIKRYRVGDATLSGNVFGEIDIAFAYDDAYGLPAWQGELSNIQRDASGNGLRFAFARSDGYGPVEYDLRRRLDPE